MISATYSSHMLNIKQYRVIPQRLSRILIASLVYLSGFLSCVNPVNSGPCFYMMTSFYLGCSKIPLALLLWRILKITKGCDTVMNKHL